jgi:hypothetical protein
VNLTNHRINAVFNVLCGLVVLWLIFLFVTHPPQRIGPLRVIVMDSGASMYPK